MNAIARTPGTIETFQTKDEWLKRRALGLGSSDAAVILGLSKWKSPLALYYEKRGMREETAGEKEFLEWGLALEPAIIAGYERTTGRRTVDAAWALNAPPAKQTRFVTVQDPDMPFLLATPDAGLMPIEADRSDRPEAFVAPPVWNAPGVLEVKNVDVSKGRDWEDTQEPPVIYTVQVQHQLMVTGMQWGSIAALVGGNRFMWADIPRDEELIAMLRKLEAEFWDMVIQGTPPPVDGSDSTKNLLARLYPRDTGEVKELPLELLEWDAEVVSAKRDLKAAEQRKAEAENKIRAAIGDATVGVCGALSYSWKHQQRREHVVKASEYRVLRRHGARDDDE